MRTWPAAIIIAAIAGPAVAEWACTMPNGVVIHSKLSGCPKDATQTRWLGSGQPPEQPRSQPIQQPAAAAPKPAPKPPTPAPQPGAPDLIDMANTVCQRLRAVGATSCEIDVNVFSPSYIDATLPTNPKDAQNVCLIVANWTKQPGSPFAGRGWQLKLFSPMGSGTRPMAQCTL